MPKNYSNYHNKWTILRLIWCTLHSIILSANLLTPNVFQSSLSHTQVTSTVGPRLGNRRHGWLIVGGYANPIPLLAQRRYLSLAQRYGFCCWPNGNTPRWPNEMDYHWPTVGMSYHFLGFRHGRCKRNSDKIFNVEMGEIPSLSINRIKWLSDR